MQEITRNIESPIYITQDGREFSLDITDQLKQLKERAQEHEKKYNRFIEFKNEKMQQNDLHEILDQFDERQHTEQFYTDYDINYSKIDQKKIEKYNPDHWKQFLIKLLRDVVNRQVLERESQRTISQIYHSVRSSDDLLRTINWIHSIYEKMIQYMDAERDILVMNKQNLKENYEFIYESGILNRTPPEELLDVNVIGNMPENVEFLIKKGFKVKTRHLTYTNHIISQTHLAYPRYEKLERVTYDNIWEKTTERESFGSKKKMKKTDGTITYGRKPINQLRDLLYDNYKGNLDDVSIKLISDMRGYCNMDALHDHYTYTEKKYRSSIHNMKLSDLLGFTLYWTSNSQISPRSIKNNKIKFNKEFNFGLSKMTSKKSVLPDKETFLKIFINIPTERHQEYAKELMESIKLDKEHITYYFMRTHDWDDIYLDDIRPTINQFKQFRSTLNYGHHNGNDEIIYYTSDNITCQNDLDQLIGKEMFQHDEPIRILEAEFMLTEDERKKLGHSQFDRLEKYKFKLKIKPINFTFEYYMKLKKMTKTHNE